MCWRGPNPAVKTPQQEKTDAWFMNGISGGKGSGGKTLRMEGIDRRSPIWEEHRWLPGGGDISAEPWWIEGDERGREGGKRGRSIQAEGITQVKSGKFGSGLPPSPWLSQPSAGRQPRMPPAAALVQSVTGEFGSYSLLQAEQSWGVSTGTTQSPWALCLLLPAFQAWEVWWDPQILSP